MKSVPIKDLKQHLAAVINDVESGEYIVVTRHGKPVALLVSSSGQHVTVGIQFGKGQLRPLFTRPATKGRYLTALLADRYEERDDR
jgi:prevent-host-death family protein